LVDFNVRVSDGTDDGLLVTRSALGTLPRYEVRLEGPARLSATKGVSYRVRAHDPKTFAPVPKASVELSLTRDGMSPKLLSATTDERGDAFFDLSLADAGNYQVVARALSSGSSESLTAQVAVESASMRALLTTDKPLYQPGQTIHLRSLALQKGDNTPLVGQALRFEIQVVGPMRHLVAMTTGRSSSHGASSASKQGGRCCSGRGRRRTPRSGSRRRS
jgi:hypothetical protein